MDPETTLEEPETARLRFRGFCYQEVAGPREALARLRELCHQWLQPEAHSKEQMLEMLVLEQFLGTLPPEIQAWVRGQRPGSPEEAAALVEGLQHDPGQLLGWVSVAGISFLEGQTQARALVTDFFSSDHSPCLEAGGAPSWKKCGHSWLGWESRERRVKAGTLEMNADVPVWDGDLGGRSKGLATCCVTQQRSSSFAMALLGSL